ncbi:hypothetical protein D3C81_1874900 [compost metagenome]
MLSCGNEGGGDCHCPPEHHDARERGTCADALQIDIARYFEEDVTQVENTGTDAVGCIGQGYVFGHAQLGE